MHGRLLFLLKLSVSLTLLSRGWLIWKWDSPIRGLIWKEDWWSGIITRWTNLTWNQFALRSDGWIATLLAGIGIVLMILSIVPWLCWIRSLRWLLWLGTFLLFVDSFAFWVEHNYELGAALEHSLQIIAPVGLFFAVSGKLSRQAWDRCIQIAAALTFCGHGFYALGWHVVPLVYQTMTMKMLRISQETAMLFLKTVGWLDLVAALFLVSRVTRKWGLLYMVLWGGATALARTVSHFGIAQSKLGLDPWLAETLVRTCHWSLPLIVLGSILNHYLERSVGRFFYTNKG